MPVEPLNVFCHFDRQRFSQYGSMDCANWYGVNEENGKRQRALYPAMGRKHIEFFGENKLIFDAEPQQLFKTIRYAYAIVGTRVIQIDKYYNQKVIGNIPLGSKVWFAYLPVGNLIYAILTAETKMYVITENGTSVSYDEVTDPNAPDNPQYVAEFGNRFVVSEKDTPDYYLSAINLGGNSLNPNTCFTINGSALFNRASGIVRQFGVLNSQLYIFSDYTTDIWANIPSQITVVNATQTFPWKINSSYNFNVGIADPLSLSIDFDRMVWLAQNESGLVSFMVSTGQRPQPISSQAINVLLENSTQSEGITPFLNGNTNGFLYQYENTIFYRASAGDYADFGILDKTQDANSIEFNFSTGKWTRVIEMNGERNRIQKHVYYNNKHLVSVLGDNAVYEMAGNVYHNELRRADTLPQDANAFVKYPMRYELITEQIFQEDYSEFITDYVEIDFVFGDKTFYQNNTAFLNAQFLIAEEAAPDGSPVYLIAEDPQNGEPVFLLGEEGNTPSLEDQHYSTLFKPHIELYVSDDGGVTFYSADLRQFSNLGVYRWKMRWYELGVSRNRVYKLLCVSSAPIVVLGAVHSTRRASGGAN